MTSLKPSAPSGCLLLSVISLTACGELTPEDTITLSRKHAIVFDQRKTHQSRTLLDRAILSSPEERKRLAQSALLTTGSALLSYEGVLSPKNACSFVDSEIKASAQLISPTRLVTAHHNISNASPTTFDIQFDGNSPDDGSWIKDPDWPADEENPLLPNRLWQLGLDYWALDTSAHKTTRTSLRKWKANLDLEGQDNAGNSLTSQPFIDDPDERLDIAFLAVSELAVPFTITTQGDPYDTPHYLASGAFDITQPGLFFNQVHADHFGRSILPNGEDTAAA